MSLYNVKQYLKKYQLENRIIELQESSATVASAALALHTKEENIAKTLSFLVEYKPILIVCSGTTRIDNHKFKEFFHTKANMIPREEVNNYIGHEPGGVCPFAIKENVDVYFDESLKKIDILYPAAGNSSSAVRLTLPELESTIENFKGYIDIGKE
ncbi:MAG: YbaK/EbsC family protein [Bacilli bacterium]|nr:YbaK/EbsC family protein [Bacilli bacterium]